MSCGQACLLWVFPAGATGRCQGTGKHSGASKLEGGWLEQRGGMYKPVSGGCGDKVGR